MKRASLDELTVEQIRDLFVANRMEQDRAELMGDTHRFRHLFDEMKKLENELRVRPGDQRRILLSLINHPNMEVRLHAALATLPIDRVAARRTLEEIWGSRQFPQAAEAGMTIKALDDGTFIPS
jgi:hypothetical protein